MSANQAYIGDHLLGLENLSREQIQHILAQAGEFRAGAVRDIPEMSVANLFFEPSTRTRVSFELAEKRLGAEYVTVNDTGSSVEKGETLLDTMLNLVAMGVGTFVVRHSAPGVAGLLAAGGEAHGLDVHVVNAGDGAHEHPTQALLDLMTVQDRLGGLTGVKVCVLGDILHSRVARSNIFGVRALGGEVAVCGPRTLVPPFIGRMGIKVFDRVEEALGWADVVNVLRLQLERMESGFIPSLQEYHEHFGLTRSRLERVGRDILVLHPGPVNRGVELESEVVDGPQSAILDQVRNGVFVRMAILYLLNGGA